MKLLVAALKDKIEKLPILTIKHTLAEHFNEKAKTKRALFSKTDYQPTRADSEDESTPINDVLAYVFELAPTRLRQTIVRQLCHCQPQDFIKLLINQREPKLSSIYALFKLPDTEANLIIKTIATLPDKQVKDIYSRISIQMLILGIPSKANTAAFLSFCQIPIARNRKHCSWGFQHRGILVEMLSEKLTDKQACLLFDVIHHSYTKNIQLDLYQGKSHRGNLYHVNIFHLLLNPNTSYALQTAKHVLESVKKHFSEAEVKALFTQMCDKQWSTRQTPLAMVFSHPSAAMTRLVLRYLQKYSFFHCFLEQEIKQKENQSLIGQAIQAQNHEAVCYCLQQPALNEAIKSLYESHYQKENNPSVWQQYFQMLPFINQIQTRPDENDLVDIEWPELIQDGDDKANLWQLSWFNENTLLHIAVQNNHEQAVQYLLTQPIHINAINAKGDTALRIALRTQQFPIVNQLITHPEIDLIMPQEKEVLSPLHQILNSSHFNHMEPAIEELLQKQNGKSVEVMITVLKWLQTQSLDMQNIEYTEAVLAEEMTPHASLSDISHMIWFLCQIGMLHRTLDNEALNVAVQDYVFSMLKRVLKDEELLKHSARLCLIILLFSMPEYAVRALIQRMPLNKKGLYLLESILCEGLSKPLIYRRLVFKNIEPLLNDLSDNALTMLIEMHLRKTDLSKLDNAILQYFANRATFESLASYIQDRPLGGLIVLALEKSHTMDDVAQHAYDWLTGKLQSALSVFNEAECTLPFSTLRLTLALSTSEASQAIIRDYLDSLPEDALLYQRLSDLFFNDKSESLAPDNSLLQTLMIEMSCNTANMAHPDYAKALKYWLKKWSVNDCVRLLNQHQKTLNPSIRTIRLLNVFQQPEFDEQQGLAFGQWLAQLMHQRKRLALGEVIDQAVMFTLKIRESLNQLRTHFSTEHQQLIETLVKALEHLANLCIEAQFDTAKSVLDIVTQPQGDHINGLVTKIQTMLSEEVGNIAPDSALCILHDCAKVHIPAFLSHAYEVCYSIYQYEQLKRADMHKGLLRYEAGENSLNTLEVSQYPKGTVQDCCQTVKARLTIIQDTFLQVANTHTNKMKLLQQYVHWHLDNGCWMRFEPLYDALTEQLSDITPTIALSMYQMIDERLVPSKMALPVIETLKQLQVGHHNLEDVITVLYKAKPSELDAFVVFTDSAKLEDFYQLASFVRHGKREGWSKRMLYPLSFVSTLPEQGISAWLLSGIKALERLSCGLFSLQALLSGYCNDESLAQERINTFTQLLQEQPQALDPEALKRFIVSYESVFLQQPDEQSPILFAFIKAFNLMMQHMPQEDQSAILGVLKLDFALAIINVCLSGLGSEDVHRAHECRQLLTYMCQHLDVMDERAKRRIQARLSQQDLDILDTNQLTSIAKTVLQSQTNLDDTTVDGVWIQRLLVSPRFIGAATCEIIEMLVARYRAISLTLKQDELQTITRCLANNMPLRDAIHRRLSALNIQQARLKYKKDWLRQKRRRLLSFYVDDSVRALFKRLEIEAKAQERQGGRAAAHARSALKTLYRYHSKQLATFRKDWLFRFSDYMYQHTIYRYGDVAKAQSYILRWLEHYLPHHNFHQRELMQHQNVYVYNDRGQKLGFISESNEVMTFLEDDVRPLLVRADAKEGMVLYDAHHHRIGSLTNNSRLNRDNLFTEHTIAALIGAVPKEELARSQHAYSLLLADVVQNNTIEYMYTRDEVSKQTAKREQLESDITHFIAQTNFPVPEETFKSIVEHHDIKQCFALLGEMQHKDNAKHYFRVLITSKALRDALFSQYRHNLKAFLKTHATSSEFVIDYLAYHQNSWFLDAFKWMVDVLKEENPELLTHALFDLARYNPRQLEAILDAFIQSDALAGHLLRCFNSTAQSYVQAISETHGKKLASLFNKQHLLQIIGRINREEVAYHSPLTRLVLFILQHQQSTLFPNEEIRLSSQHTWQEDELSAVGKFFRLHVQHNCPFDKDGRIARDLLALLTFRTANYGQVDWLYKKPHQLLLSLLQTPIKHPQKSIAKLCYEQVQDKCIQIKNALPYWLTRQNPQQHNARRDLEAHHAVIDWEKMVQDAWRAFPGAKQLPCIVLFLMNYSGAAKTLKTLLEDCFASDALWQNRTLIYQITQLMGQVIKPDVSGLMFETLTQALNQKPALLDTRLLAHMATYHQVVHLKKTNIKNTHQAHFDLLHYLGQRRMYGLVQQGCELLQHADDIEHMQVQKVRQVQREAHVEQFLSSYISRWFFPVLQFFVRFWHYGRQAFHYVKRCDDAAPYPNRIKTPEYIRTAYPSGKLFSDLLKTSHYREKLRTHFEALIQERPEQTGAREQTQPEHHGKVSKQGVFGYSVKLQSITSDPGVQTLCRNI